MPLPAPTQLPPPKKPLKNDYWFVVGQNPLLSAAEIAAVLSLSPTDFVLLEKARILRVAKAAPAEELINKIGGTIKIARGLANNLNEVELLASIKNELKQKAGKIVFGISYHGQRADNASAFGKKIKTALKNEGLSARHVFNREPTLSSVSVQKNGLLRKGGDFIILERADGKFDLAKTLAVQPFEKLSARDYGRPGRDDKSGMLPPKLAMIMINLAQTKKDGIILDPFCGSGTILTEAFLLGYQNLIGADISAQAVADSKQNLAWIKKQYASLNMDALTKIFQADAKNISAKITEPIEAIITEPLLGKPLRGNETEKVLSTQANELRALYLSAFQEFYKILRPQGKIIFIIPRFKFRKEWIKVNCVSEIKKSGFSADPLLDGEESLLYHRPGQFVGRELWRFVKV